MGGESVVHGLPKAANTNRRDRDTTPLRDRDLEARARAGAAHGRRRARLRRHDRAARRGGLRRPLRRLLDRDPLAAARLPARHARPRGARGDGGARDPGAEPDRARLRRAHVPRAAAGDPRAARRALGGVAARRRLPALDPRRPPGSPDDRAGGAACVQADDGARLRDPVEQLRLRLRDVRGARAAAPRAEGRGARALRLPAPPALRERRVRLEPRPRPRRRT